MDTTVPRRPKSFKAALIDISGTLHVGKDAIPGSIDACRKLFRHGLKVIFLTNTSKMSSASLLNQLRSIGFDDSAIPDDVACKTSIIMTSVSATRQFLLQNELRPYCLVEDELIEQDFQGVERHDPNCVLVGLAPTKLNYERLNAAFRLLMCCKEKQRQNNVSKDNESPPLLIAIHRATHYRDSDHQLSLGPGGFITLLEQTTGVTAHVIGKPSHSFYRAALVSLGVDVDPYTVAMVGDDVVGDIQGAINAGLGAAILVKTGKYVSGDESGHKTGGVVPTLTVNSIVEAVEYICSSVDGAEVEI